MRRKLTIHYDVIETTNREVVTVRLACGVSAQCWTEGEALMQALRNIRAVDNHKLVEMSREFFEQKGDKHG